MYTLLYLKWINNKDLLYNNGTVFNVMWQPGWVRGWGIMDTCIHVAESLPCSPETLTLLISYIPIQNKKFFLKPSCLKEAVSRELYKNYTQYSGTWIRSGPCLPVCYTMGCRREGQAIKSSMTIKIAILLPVQRSLSFSEIQKAGQTKAPLICYNFLYV